MRVLIAEDDGTSRLVLQTILDDWGYEVTAASDGDQAWALLQVPDSPKLVILDRLMPGLDGTEVCRRVRELKRANPPYIVLLTALGSREDVIDGLDAGADDYVSKPYNKKELRARLRVAERVIDLQSALSNRVAELEDALSHVRKLQGIIPICSHCHRIRNDAESWERMENYIQAHSEAQFSHGVCPECFDEHYPS